MKRSFSKSVVLTTSTAMLLALACGKDPAPAPGPSAGTGGRKTGGSGGSRTGGSGGSSTTGGTSGGGSGGSTGGTGGSPDAGNETSGEVATSETGSETGGEVSPPSGTTTYVLVTSGAGYNQATPIVTLKLDLATGGLTKVSTYTGLTAAMYGGVSPNKKFAYFATEEMPQANIGAFSIGPTGALTKLGDTKTGAANGEHVGMHPNGKWLAIPHFTNGEVTVHPIGEDGKVGPASDTKSAGTGAPAGCHQALFDKSGTKLFVACKAPEKIAQFTFAAGKLTPNTSATADGPGQIRHVAFSPDERFAYGLTEKDNQVLTYAYDKTTGKLTLQPEKLPATAMPGGAMVPSASHILVHPTGKFLFTASRSDNVIVTFTLDPTSGKPTRASENKDVGGPRDFDVDPSGKYLVAGSTPDGGKTPGEVVALSIDQTTGKLTKVGTPIKVESYVWYVGTFSVP